MRMDVFWAMASQAEVQTAARISEFLQIHVRIKIYKLYRENVVESKLASQFRCVCVKFSNYTGPAWELCQAFSIWEKAGAQQWA